MTPLEIPKEDPIPEGARVLFETDEFYYVVPDQEFETDEFSYLKNG